MWTKALILPWENWEKEAHVRRPILSKPGHQEAMLEESPVQLASCWIQIPWPSSHLMGQQEFISSEKGTATLGIIIKQSINKINAMCSFNKCNLATWEGSTQDVYEHIIQSTGNLRKWSERLGGLDGRVPAPSDGESSSRVTSSATSSATVSGSRPWVLMKAWACLHLLGCWEAKIARSVASPSRVATSV